MESKFKLSLVDFDGAADVVNNVINKLSEAVGWVANRKTPQRIAIESYIADIQNSDYDAFTKAALISNAKKIIREYKNQYCIIALANHNIHNAEGVLAVDNDWIGLFMESAKNVSNEEFQKIWALVFSAECNDPGCIPKSLLYILQKMDQYDADRFVKFSSLVVKVWNDYTPFIMREFFNPKERGRGIYEKVGVSFSDITQLETLGLVIIDQMTFSDGFLLTQTENEEGPSEVSYFGDSIQIPNGVNKIRVGYALLTKDGMALCRLIEKTEAEGFWNYVKDHIKSGWEMC